MNYSVTQDSLTYTSLPLFSAWIDSLAPSQQIFYRVGNPSEGFSPEYRFVSLPDSSEPQAPGSSAKMLVVGDMGTAIPMGATVCQWIEAELAANPTYNITLHAGDLAYAGVNSHGEWEPTWDGQGCSTQVSADPAGYSARDSCCSCVVLCVVRDQPG